MSTKLPTHANFAKSLNTVFQVTVDQVGTIQLTLSEVSELRESKRQERFSLIFRGPRATFLPQGLYGMKHEKIGSMDLFIVPVAMEEEEFLYEAVFNQLLTKKKWSGKKRARQKKVTPKRGRS